MTQGTRTRLAYLSLACFAIAIAVALRWLFA